MADAAIRPANLYLIDARAGSQPEMDFRGVGGEVAAAGPHLRNLLAVASQECNTRADRVAPAGPPEAAQRDPVIAGRAIVVQQQRRALVVDNQHVEPAVAVVVPDRYAAANDLPCEVRTCSSAHILILAADIVQKQGWLGVGLFCGSLLHLRHYVAVCEGDVGPAVVGGVDERDPEIEHAQRRRAETGGIAGLREYRSLVVKEAFWLGSEVRHEQVESTIAVVVSPVDAHA